MSDGNRDNKPKTALAEIDRIEYAGTRKTFIAGPGRPREPVNLSLVRLIAKKQVISPNTAQARPTLGTANPIATSHLIRTATGAAEIPVEMPAS